MGDWGGLGEHKEEGGEEGETYRDTHTQRHRDIETQRRRDRRRLAGVSFLFWPKRVPSFALRLPKALRSRFAERQGKAEMQR